MKLRAALKQHQGASARNESLTPAVQVAQLWSYHAGKWRTSYEVVGIDPESVEPAWQQMCADLDEVERYLKQAFPQESSHWLDPDAWS